MSISNTSNVGKEEKETQAGLIDVEMLHNMVSSLNESFGRLRMNNMYVTTGFYYQNGKLQEMENSLENTADGLESLINAMYRVQQKLDQNKIEMAKLDTEYSEHLQEHVAQLQVEDSLVGVTKTDTEVLSPEEDCERRMLDFAKSDLEMKNQDLHDVTDMAAMQKDELLQEWNAFKDDLAKYREERLPYELEIRNIHNNAIARLREMQANHTSDDSENTESENIAKSLRYLEIERELKDIKDENQNLHVLSRDLDTEISGLIAERNQLLKKNDILLQEIDFIMPFYKQCGYPLHKTNRHIDLPHRDEESDLANEDGDLGVLQTGECEHFGGKLLHRCTKRTNIALPPEAWEDLNDDSQLNTTQDNTDDIHGSPSDEEKSSSSSSDQGADDQARQIEPDTSTAQGTKPKTFSRADDYKVKSSSSSGEEDVREEDPEEDLPKQDKLQQCKSSPASQRLTMEGVIQAPSQSLVSKLRSRLGAGASSTSSSNLAAQQPIRNMGKALGKQSSARYTAEMLVQKSRPKRR